MGMEERSKMRIVLCKVRKAKKKFWEPKAWLQMGSMPMARPAKTE